MNDLKQQLVTALRSGQYKQGIRRLRTGSGDSEYFCFLGVVADVIDPQGWGGMKYVDAWEHHGLTASLDPRVFAKAGLDHKAQDVLWDLMCANDRGESFEQLAAKVEELL
jgi:hypothetical protein